MKFERTLIVEQNREYILELKEILEGYIDEVEFALDGKAAIDIYDDFRPDLVLVEAILPEYDGFMLLEKIVDDDIIKIMFTCMNNELIVKKADALKVDYLFFKPYDKAQFLKRLLEVAEMKGAGVKKSVGFDSDVMLKGKISVLLRRFGIPTSMRGFAFIREALLIMRKQNKVERLSSNENLYKAVAEEYKTNHKNVERNIRHAIETAASRADPEIYNRYFGYSINTEKGKPTSGEFLATLCDLLDLGTEI